MSISSRQNGKKIYPLTVANSSTHPSVKSTWETNIPWPASNIPSLSNVCWNWRQLVPLQPLRIFTRPRCGSFWLPFQSVNIKQHQTFFANIKIVIMWTQLVPWVVHRLQSDKNLQPLSLLATDEDHIAWPWIAPIAIDDNELEHAAPRF